MLTIGSPAFSHSVRISLRSFDVHVKRIGEDVDGVESDLLGHADAERGVAAGLGPGGVDEAEFHFGMLRTWRASRVSGGERATLPKLTREVRQDNYFAAASVLNASARWRTLTASAKGVWPAPLYDEALRWAAATRNGRDARHIPSGYNGHMDWHRHFGLLLTDFFTGSPFVVELEKDLSLRQQYLDVVIIRKGRGRLTEPLPDGLDDLADHNLVSFKSHHEALDDWALKELTGHYVNYRKQVGRGDEPLLPESAFRLYAVCSRFPHNLAQLVPWEMLRPGVYDCRRGTDCIRVVAESQLPLSEHNAPLHLFSASPERVRFGRQHSRQRSPNTSTLILQLFKGYQEEGVVMPYTMENFQRDYAMEHFKDLTLQEQLEVLKNLPPEKLEDFKRALKEVEAERSSPGARNAVVSSSAVTLC